MEKNVQWEIKGWKYILLIPSIQIIQNNIYNVKEIMKTNICLMIMIQMRVHKKLFSYPDHFGAS